MTIGTLRKAVFLQIIRTCIRVLHFFTFQLGLPNAGKSTLLQAISRARPKVAPYPFTTLKPFLGVINYSDFEQIAGITFFFRHILNLFIFSCVTIILMRAIFKTVADLPGLIEGSHLNYGLGIQFLKHAERCSCLLMVLDTSNDPCYDLEILRTELKAFSIDLANKKQIIIANKMDLEESKVAKSKF